MKCEKCDNEFSVGKHKCMLYSLKTKRIYYFCSEKCLKKFEKEYPSYQFMKVNQGDEK